MRNLVAALTLRFVDRLTNPARASARAIGEIAKAERMADSAGKQWTKGLSDLDGHLDRLAKASLVTDGLSRAGEAMIRPLRGAVVQGAAFEAAMTGIGITAQLTDSQLAPLRDNILGTASDLGALPATVQGTFGAILAEGVFKTEAELSRAGVAVARFQRLQAAMGEPLSDQEAGSWSSALGSSLKLRADQLERANAMANRSAQQGGVSGAALARALPSQTGALVGLNFANERGLADLLTANQIAKRLAGNSSEATNNISNLMGKLASPEVLKNFDDIGINLEAQIKAGVAAGRSPLETLAQITRTATKADQFRIGELFGDVQAKNGLMAIVQNFDEFKRMSAELQGANVLPAYLADIDRAARGPAASFARYTSGISRAGIATGTILAPAVGLAADALSKVANWMSKATESGNPLVRTAVYVVAGLAGVAVAAGAVGHAVVGVLGPLFIMRSLFGDLGGSVVKTFAANIIRSLAQARLAVIGFNLSMLANPVVLAVAAAIAAVALVVIVVRKYWGPISAFMTGVGQVIGEALAPLGEALRPLVPIWNAVTRAIGGFFGWIGRLLQPVKSTQAELEGATSAGRRFGQGLVFGFRIILAPITAAVTSVRMGIGLIKSIMAWNPVAALRSAWGGVRTFFSGMRGLFAGFGRMILQGLINGIISMAGPVGRAIAQVGTAGANALKARLGIRSPSRVFAGLGVNTMEGLTMGLNRAAPGPIARVAAMGAALVAALPAAASADVSMNLGSSAQGAAGASAPASGPAAVRGAVTIEKIEQHFHLPPGSPADPRALAKELKRLEGQGVRRALDDGELR